MYKLLSVLIFTHAMFSLAAQTTRLVVPNVTLKPDSTGKISLLAIEADVFREGINVWSGKLKYLYTGGDSSTVILEQDGKQVTLSLQKAIDDTLIGLHSILWQVRVEPKKKIKLIAVTTRQLTVGQQKETSVIKPKVFQLFNKPAYQENIKKGKLDLMQIVELEALVKLEVHNQNPERSLSEFARLKLDTSEHPFWNVQFKEGKFYVHESTDTTNGMPASGMLAQVFSSSTAYFGLRDINYCITLDSATRTPVVEIDGKYNNAIPIKLRFTSDYKASCIIRRDRLFGGNEGGPVTINFWRDIDIERFYYDNPPCYQRASMSWCVGGKLDVTNPSPCPSIKKALYVSNVFVFF